MPWTSIVASDTTWTALGSSDATWTAAQGSVHSYGWIPYSHITDLWRGVDFVPIASTNQPAKASTHRPLVVYNISTITAAAFAAEARP